MTPKFIVTTEPCNNNAGLTCIYETLTEKGMPLEQIHPGKKKRFPDVKTEQPDYNTRHVKWAALAGLLFGALVFLAWFLPNSALQHSFEHIGFNILMAVFLAVFGGAMLGGILSTCLQPIKQKEPVPYPAEEETLSYLTIACISDYEKDLVIDLCAQEKIHCELSCGYDFSPRPEPPEKVAA